MRVSRERLQVEADATGFRPEVLEKVFQLLNLLDGLNSHPFLRDRLALKGGTALNLFVFDLPRLSVDVDLNYVGAVDRDTMLTERPRVEQAIEAVCSREDMTLTRPPQDHAGGKWRLRYASSAGGGGNLALDLNYMFRSTLWPVRRRSSRRVGAFAAKRIAVMDKHELAAGKLAALLSRRASRDLFDAHQLFKAGGLDHGKLRLAFVLYGAMNRRDWRTVRIEDVTAEPVELRNQLLPVIRPERRMEHATSDQWAAALVEGCRKGLEAVLPFSEHERAFLDGLLDQGRIDAELLTPAPSMAARIRAHPLLQWKAANVRKHRGH